MLAEERLIISPLRAAVAMIRVMWLVMLLVAMTVDGLFQHARRNLRTPYDGAHWNHRWCRRLVRALGLRVIITGRLRTSSHRFQAIVCNHLSYIDVLLLCATLPCIMVAKSEVRSWPALGWLAQLSGTVFVYRGSRPETYPEVNASMARAFRSGLPVLFFPEGTTTDDSHLLAFRRGLFHSVLRDGAQIQAAAIKYTLTPADTASTVAKDVCWVGDAALVPHLFRLLSLRGVNAFLCFGPIAPGSDRFALSQNAHDAVADLRKQLLKTFYTVSDTILEPVAYQPPVTKLF